jgi:hypothetical protein
MTCRNITKTYIRAATCETENSQQSGKLPDYRGDLADLARDVETCEDPHTSQPLVHGLARPGKRARVVLNPSDA